MLLLLHHTVDEVQIVHQQTVVVHVEVFGWWGESKVEPAKLIVQVTLLLAAFHDRFVHCQRSGVGILALLLLLLLLCWWRSCRRRVSSDRCVLILEGRQTNGQSLV